MMQPIANEGALQAFTEEHGDEQQLSAEQIAIELTTIKPPTAISNTPSKYRRIVIMSIE